MRNESKMGHQFLLNLQNEFGKVISLGPMPDGGAKFLYLESSKTGRRMLGVRDCKHGGLYVLISQTREISG